MQVCLASKARLRHDPQSGRHVLLYPERGLELSESAAAIARLCQEEIAIGALVDALWDAARGADIADAGDVAGRLGAAESGAGALRARIERDVLAFLSALERRGLLITRGGAQDD